MLCSWQKRNFDDPASHPTELFNEVLYPWTKPEKLAQGLLKRDTRPVDL
jgi:hypothetical protein